MSKVKIFLSLIVLLLFFSIIYVFCVNMPLVVKSYSSGECLEVLSYKDNYSCDNMPKKYILEWAK